MRLKSVAKSLFNRPSERVRKPARYLGKEINAVLKTLSNQSSIGAGLSDLYGGDVPSRAKNPLCLANGLPDVYAERVLPPAPIWKKY